MTTSSKDYLDNGHKTVSNIRAQVKYRFLDVNCSWYEKKLSCNLSCNVLFVASISKFESETYPGDARINSTVFQGVESRGEIFSPPSFSQ